MGSWSVYCGISQIAITAGQPCVLLPLKKGNGDSYLPYLPATLPIFGEYDDYGGIENIEKTLNTKTIEEHFGISIEEFTCFLVDGKFTYNRDEATNVSKKMNRFAEAENWNFMWIDRKVWDFMSTCTPKCYGGAGDLDFGRPEILTLLGFEQSGETNNERYSQKWTKGTVTVHSDGQWCQTPEGQGIHTFDGSYNALSDLMEITEDIKWIGEKAEWQLWEHLEDSTAREKLCWIIGKRHGYVMSDELYEILAKRLENLSNTNTEEAKVEWDKIQKMKEAEQANKSLADIYYDRFREFGDLLSALVTIRFNLHPMSGYFAPFVLYLTPQCGEYKHHQTILDSFAKINSELISERVYDEDEE